MEQQNFILLGRNKGQFYFCFFPLCLPILVPTDLLYVLASGPEMK